MSSSSQAIRAGPLRIIESAWFRSSARRMVLAGVAVQARLSIREELWRRSMKVNEFGSRAIPLLASPQGGVAEQSRNYCEASADCEAGVVFRLRTKGKPPRLRQLRWLRDIFLMTQPPLLAVMQGGEWPARYDSFTLPLGLGFSAL